MKKLTGSEEIDQLRFMIEKSEDILFDMRGDAEEAKTAEEKAAWKSSIDAQVKDIKEMRDQLRSLESAEKKNTVMGKKKGGKKSKSRLGRALGVASGVLSTGLGVAKAFSMMHQRTASRAAYRNSASVTHQWGHSAPRNPIRDPVPTPFTGVPLAPPILGAQYPEIE